MSTVLVIGAGVGGLAAAARLAAHGHDVTVLEQSPHIGGKLGWESFSGCGFDTGPSLLTLPALLRDTFEQTGGWPDSLVLQRVSPLSSVRFADGSGFTVHDDLDQFCAELEAWAPGAGQDWSRLATRAARMWEATKETFVERELRGARSLLRLVLSRPQDVPLVAPWESLAGLGARFLREPRLQQFLWRYATYTGSDPRRAPAVLATIAHVEHTYGGWYVPGGLHRIATALAERATECGATVRTNSSVRRVVLEAGRARGVVLDDGEHLSADVLVANCDAQQLYGDLLATSTRVAAVRSRLAAAGRSYSGVALLVAVRGARRSDTPHHTVLFPRNYTAEFDDLAAGRPIRDPAVYLSVPADDSIAGPDVHPWFVLVNAPRNDQYDWRSADRTTVASDVLDLMAERGYDIRDRIADWRVRTPADIEDRTFSPGGAIYGSSADGARAAFLRPANRSAVPGLFLVGGSSHPGGGLPLVLASAHIVDRLIGPAGR